MAPHLDFILKNHLAMEIGWRPDSVLDKHEQLPKQVLLSLANHTAARLLGARPASDTMAC